MRSFIRMIRCRMVANFIGFDVAFSQSLPGVLVLLVIDRKSVV